jgi:hypothetical protein
MNELENNVANSRAKVTTTSLYDLIGALNERIGPNNDNVITANMADLNKTGNIKWIRPRKKFYEFDCQIQSSFEELSNSGIQCNMEKVVKNKSDNIIVYLCVCALIVAFIFGLVYLAWIRSYL